jgi:predicted RNA-binding protein YlqC (UPF0109 family)
MSIEGLIEKVAKGLVDEPDEVIVEAIDEERETVYELTVAPDDLGRVIGRQGRTANAIRTLAIAAAKKTGDRIQVEILD